MTLSDTLYAAGWTVVMQSAGWGFTATVYVRGDESCVVLDHNPRAHDLEWRLLPADARDVVLYLEPPPKARAWALTPLQSPVHG